ncbi:MAG: 2Fe-2S iron-sulfur cluster binding domain-containing protein [Spirochaetales bacterium]|nr:2Fe-2S iron-sulfur cluster binding domain-containing protein [Spirochaetales bacterium]
MNIICNVNGKEVAVETRPDKKLSAVLRDDLNLKGIRKGCGTGRCGSCLILLDDQLVASCLVPAFAARHKSIVTIEGFSQTKEFSDIVTGFKEAGVHLCSYCAPARVLSTAYMLRKHIMPTEEQINDIISSVQCRCSSFSHLKKGIIQASIHFSRRKDNG